MARSALDLGTFFPLNAFPADICRLSEMPQSRFNAAKLPDLVVQ